MNEDYMRVEFSMAAVRREDYTEVRKALWDLRMRFCRGGSSVGICSVTEGTKITDER